jgi:hypothetical protein
MKRLEPAGVRDALFGWVLSVPAFLAACAVPDGGLFRAARFRDVHIYGKYAERFLHGDLPYRDFFVEYPPGAFAVFMPPTAFGDSHYNAAFKSLMALCGVATILLVALVLVELGASRGWLFTGVGLLALAPIALGPISLNTYDAWPALLTVLALFLFLRGRDLPGAGLLGLAVSTKVYPLVLVPVAGIYVWRRAGPRRLALALVVLVTVAAVVVVPFAAYDLHGVASSFRSQAERGLQIESLGASVLLAADRLGLYAAKVVTTTGVAGRNLSGSLPDAVAVVTPCSKPLQCSPCGSSMRARCSGLFARRLRRGSRRLSRLHEGLLAAVPRLARAAGGAGGERYRRGAHGGFTRACPSLVLPLPRALPARVADLAAPRARPACARRLPRAGQRACA